MAKSNPTKDRSSKTVNLNSHAPTREDIERRAFELFLARGSEHGHAEEDWLEAERELRGQR